ncbi:MAG: hypothetical protein HKN13_01780 [Rhodothermales bacterium]|nr:hypothetical protein [Rhodothermales bacterium]
MGINVGTRYTGAESDPFMDHLLLPIHLVSLYLEPSVVGDSNAHGSPILDG